MTKGSKGDSGGGECEELKRGGVEMGRMLEPEESEEREREKLTVPAEVEDS